MRILKAKFWSLSLVLVLSNSACNGNIFSGFTAPPSTAKKQNKSAPAAQSGEKTWEERLEMTNQEIIEEQLAIASETVGDDGFEIQGFYFEGLETILTTSLEDLLSRPELAEETLEETFERLGMDPRETVELDDSEQTEILERNEQFLIRGLSANESETDMYLLQNETGMCTMKNSDNWSPGTMKDGKCVSKAAERLDAVAATNPTEACAQSQKIQADNAAGYKTWMDPGVAIHKKSPNSPDPSMAMGAQYTMVYAASYDAAKTWSASNGCK